MIAGIQLKWSVSRYETNILSGQSDRKELESIENLLQYLDELNHSCTRTENTVVVAVNGKKAQFELNEISFGAIYDCLDTIKHG